MTESLENDELYNAFMTGKFVEQVEQGWLFDIGADEQALVPADDLAEGTTFAAGAEVELLVERPYAGHWAASVSKVDKLRKWDELVELAKNQSIVEGEVIGSNKGGLSVDIGLRAFVPKSQVDIHKVRDFSPYIGRVEKFLVSEFDEQRCNVVLSRRALLEEKREENREELIENLAEGQEYDGVVRNVVDFGAFIDIGGVEGLLHSSNMSWGRVDHPSELFRPGDRVRVVVLKYDENKDRLSLGRKQLLADPWEGITERYEEGQTVEGEVVSLADFGAFVAVEPGLEGLVHVTELSWTDRVNHPRDVLQMGAKVAVKVIGVNPEERRLSLSIKQLQDNPWNVVAEQMPPGTVVTGTITNIVDFGLFVEIVRGVEGLVHVSDLSWTEKIDDPSERWSVGDEIEVKVIDIDVEAGRASLGHKQLEDDPWERAAEIAVVGEKVPVTITRTTEFGAFAEIAPGIEGLIHISELAEGRVERVESVARQGQSFEALVMSFDRANQRISLSLKRDELDGPDIKEYSDEGSATALGDVLRSQLGLEGDDEGTS